MNVTLLWMMLIPIVGAALLYYANQKHLPWWGWIVSALPGMAFIGIVFAVSYGGAIMDTEIWNGQVTSKERKHGSYVETYQCNCRPGPQSCSGTGSSRSCTSTTVCDTCTRDHYTVHWYAHSTIGTYTIDSLDRTSRSVYLTPDPQRYTIIQPGDPCAKTSSYTNYVQAVPQSLFASISGDLTTRYKNMIPPYPDQVFDFYKINRFLTVGFNFTDAAAWNHDISMMLRELGPKKQVNVIIVVVKTTDTDYQYALQKAWEGANKNDVVLVIGSEDGRAVNWVGTLSWTKSEIFKIELNQAITELGTIDREKVIPAISAQISKNFERRRMREFEYLAGEIDPPMWLLVTTILLLIAGYGGTAYYMKNHAFGQGIRRRF